MKDSKNISTTFQIPNIFYLIYLIKNNWCLKLCEDVFRISAENNIYLTKPSVFINFPLPFLYVYIYIYIYIYIIYIYI